MVGGLNQGSVPGTGAGSEESDEQVGTTRLDSCAMKGTLTLKPLAPRPTGGISSPSSVQPVSIPASSLKYLPLALAKNTLLCLSLKAQPKSPPLVSPSLTLPDLKQPPLLCAQTALGTPLWELLGDRTSSCWGVSQDLNDPRIPRTRHNPDTFQGLRRGGGVC